MNLAQLLADMDDKPRSSKPAILPEAAIERLKETALRIAAGNPFKVGDIVTIRADAPMQGAGKPRLVIGINPEGFPCGEKESGQWGTAITYDVSFIWTDGEHILPHVAPHWMLEPYNPS